MSDRRKIDGKFHIEGGKIVKTTSGEIVPHDEPLWLIRARDYLALPTLEHYIRLCELDGCTDWQLGGIRAAAEKFKRFTVEHPERVKQPGITKGAAFQGEKSPMQQQRDALAAFVAEQLESGPLRIRKVFEPSHHECLGCHRIGFEPDDISHTAECLRERGRKALEGRTS